MVVNKNSILKIKILCVIILNIIKLRDIQYCCNSSKLINRLYDAKNLSKLFYDILSFNIYSILFSTITNYSTIKKLYKYLFKKDN
jgi:hypothetical protein